MKRAWLLLLCGGLAAAAEENFSAAVRPEEFAAAGLAKLSPAELARLDALVRDYKSGALLEARRAAEMAAQAQAAAEARAAQAETARAEAAKAEAMRVETARAEAARKTEPGPSLLAKAKVLLTPGTQIEYATVESRISGEFRGWDPATIFTLEDGSRWRVLNGSSYSTPPMPPPKVKVVPANLGGFWMTIEGVHPRVRVEPLAR